jgi:hypothetical protein
MYEYNKPWYAFGIIKKIYYSKHRVWLIDFTNGTNKRLRDCKLDDFYYSYDKNAFMKAYEASDSVLDQLDYLIIFSDD